MLLPLPYRAEAGSPYSGGSHCRKHGDALLLFLFMRKRWPHGHPPPTDSTCSCMLGHAFHRRRGSGRDLNPTNPTKKPAGDRPDLNPTIAQQGREPPSQHRAERWLQALWPLSGLKPNNQKGETKSRLSTRSLRRSHSQVYNFEVWRKFRQRQTAPSLAQVLVP